MAEFDDHEWETEDFKCPYCGVASDDDSNKQYGCIVSHRHYGENEEKIVLTTCVCGKQYYEDVSP